MTEANEAAAIADKLRRRYPAMAAEKIEALVASAFETFRSARIRQFVPLLVERSVSEQLRH